jgi:hypothetical protein
MTKDAEMTVNHVTRGFTSDAINEFAFRLFLAFHKCCQGCLLRGPRYISTSYTCLRRTIYQLTFQPTNKLSWYPVAMYSGGRRQV